MPYLVVGGAGLPGGSGATTSLVAPSAVNQSAHVVGHILYVAHGLGDGHCQNGGITVAPYPSNMAPDYLPAHFRPAQGVRVLASEQGLSTAIGTIAHVLGDECGAGGGDISRNLNLEVGRVVSPAIAHGGAASTHTRAFCH